MINVSELWLLGAVAGLTIFLGLPVAFNRNRNLKGFMNSIATGILIFLLIDIMQEAISVVQTSIISYKSQTLIPATDPLILMATMLIGVSVGLLGLVYFEQTFIKKVQTEKDGVQKAKMLALMIAIGIGLHNFSEGLAIGQSYISGAIHLAILLVIGFGLHNMTEGFGIAGPLHSTKPSPKYLLILGVIGGGPTFLGTIIGSLFQSQIISLLFLSLAGGAIIYVVKELLYHGRISGEDMKMMLGLLLGFFIGLGTGLILTVAGI